MSLFRLAGGGRRGDVDARPAWRALVNTIEVLEGLTPGAWDEFDRVRLNPRRPGPSNQVRALNRGRRGVGGSRA